jgi:hypothetical protein
MPSRNRKPLGAIRCTGPAHAVCKDPQTGEESRRSIGVTVGSFSPLPEGTILDHLGHVPSRTTSWAGEQIDRVGEARNRLAPLVCLNLLTDLPCVSRVGAGVSGRRCAVKAGAWEIRAARLQRKSPSPST